MFISYNYSFSIHFLNLVMIINIVLIALFCNVYSGFILLISLHHGTITEIWKKKGKK